MRKRLLIVMPSMFIGGAERSLLGLLEAIDYQQYDVDLFLYRHQGEFMEYIPNSVNLLPECWQYTTFDVPIKELLRDRRFFFGCSRLMSKVAMKIHCLRTKERPGVWMAMQYISRGLQWLLPNIPGKYDAAITFLGIPDILVNKVDAKVRLAWNHTDYTVLYPDIAYDKSVYNKIDYVVSVSEPCREQFLKVHPTLENKAITIENVLSTKLLQEQSKEYITDLVRQDDEIILLSIGRFCDAKNFDNIPEICKLIRNRGLNVLWYIIGYGKDEELIRRKIIEFGMEQYVHILGVKSNPYPYIKQCDVYVQPSRYEGKAVTVIEAQTLAKPVIITEFATAHSQVKNGVDGVIVPMDNEGCAVGIAEVLCNPELMNKLSENCSQQDYSNVQEMEKLYKVLRKVQRKKC